MRKIAIIALLLMPLALQAKPTYKITVKIDNCTDTMLLLGYHYAEHTYVCDTAYRKGKGRFVFEGEQELHPGLYFFTNNARRYVEFVIYGERPFFTLHTNEADWSRHMQVEGSAQNTVMFDYQRQNNALYDELAAAKQGLDSISFLLFRNRQFQRLDSLKMALVEQHPDAMIGKMIYATKEVDVPLHHPDSTPMTDRERYDWYMAHYFDHMPLGDDFIVRTPKEIFYKRVMTYVDDYMRGMPPSMIIPLLDTMIERSASAPEVFKWLVHTMTEKFLQSNIMVYDEVYVHLVQRYYATGRAFWSSPSVIDEQVERANRWERLLVGREAPELILYDTMHVPHSLHHMPGRYTLLLFWSPTCGHCREVIPDIYKAFDELQQEMDLSAFAILSEPDEATTAKWHRFLADHQMHNPRWVNLHGGEANVDWHEVYDVVTTPQIYLIDNSTHRFVAKKLNGKLLRDILRQLKAEKTE